MRTVIRGIDFAMNTNQMFKTEYATNDVIATCFGVTQTYNYNKNGQRQGAKGWSYKVYVPAREMIISIKVDDLTCAVDASQLLLAPAQVKFTNFSAFFYVGKNSQLEISCKADSAEEVAVNYEQEVF